MNASVFRLLLLLCGLGIVALLAALLLLALGLLHLDFSPLFAVARALVVQLVVLGYDFRFAAFAVAATASAGGCVSKMLGVWTRVCLPQLDVDLAAFLLLAVGENGVVVLLQAGLHAIKAVELDEAGAHELLGSFVCAQPDLGRVQLGEVLCNGFFRRGVGKVALRSG
jgi:hypothetical protein